MDTTENQHPKEALFYGLARMLERASFFGFRALMVVYMIGETFNMETNQALYLYGWFTALLIFFKIMGGIFGDFLFGNRQAIMIGGILQAIGAFSFCIPSMIGLYLGGFFVIMGSGLYSSNIVAELGKSYLDRPKLLDAGFTWFYLAVNLGAFLGVWFITSMQGQYGYQVGFIVSGVLILLSLIPMLYAKRSKLDATPHNPFTLGMRIVKVLLALVAVTLFWAVYELSSWGINFLGTEFVEELGVLPENIWTSLNSILVLLICLLAAIVWSYRFSTSFFKLTVGFVLGAIAFGIFLFIPDAPSEQHTNIFLFAFFILCAAEVFVAPVLHSVLTRYGNPKFLATLIGLTALPSLVNRFIGFLSERLGEHPDAGLEYGLIFMVGFSALLIVFLLLTKRPTKDQQDKTFL
ncbi:MAG: MFS transporter [Bacteroidota bacterium]